MKAHPIISSGTNKWIVLNHDMDRPLNVADTNQVVLTSANKGTLIDPGGIETFPVLLSSLHQIIPIGEIKNIIFTSADPQSVSSLALWKEVCGDDLNIWAPTLWTSLIGHLDSSIELTIIPEDGIDLFLNQDCRITLIPSHHLHSPASYSIFDPNLGFLYSGSIGSSELSMGSSSELFVSNFRKHEEFLLSYHGRWFASTLARENWLDRIEPLDIKILVPQRGPAFSGENVRYFLNWFKSAELGTVLISNPLVSQGTYEASLEVLDTEYDTQNAETIENRGLRLVTRSDFDGIACAVILEELGLISDILFAEPNEMQEGRVAITDKDIITNLPYVEGCYMAFDHHLSEVSRITKVYENHINEPQSPSTARVVFDYFGGKGKLPKISRDMMLAVDQSDSAQYDIKDILEPEGWTLLSFIMDPRSGLGRFHGFRIPHFEMMMGLVDHCRKYEIHEILSLPDIKERADFLAEQKQLFQEQIKRCSTVVNNLVILDLLEEKVLYAGNRFMIYALFPECNISMTLMWGRDRQKVIFSLGKSIIDRSSDLNIGNLMLSYGGGGHMAAGTCHISPIILDTVRDALVKKINEVG